MDTVQKLQAAIDALVQATIDPAVEAEMVEGDERLFHTAIGALVEYRETIEDRAAV